MIKRTAPLLFLLTGLLLIAVGLVYRQYTRSTSSPGPAPLPAQLAGQAQSRTSYGESAVQEISQLHGKGFPLSSGAVASYGSEGSRSTLWVAGAPARLLAMGIVADMADAIAAGDSPFTPLGKVQIDGRDVYELTGMGQQHYYFRSAELIVWLAADAPIANEALAETLAFYP